MAASNESSTSKRRPGRRRLPPLEPGPALQFVVANHPDQFRAGKTMRHIRSHVMYKQRTERKTTSNDRTNHGLHRSASERGSSTPIPIVRTSEAVSNDISLLASPQTRPRSRTCTGGLPDCISCPPTLPLFQTIYRILFPTAEASTRSAPPMSEDTPSFPFPDMCSTERDPFRALTQEYINSSAFFCNDRKWMEYVCSDPMSFLSHVGVSCVYQDLMDGLLHDSKTTMSAKTRVLSGMADRLEANDATILTILHLLLSEASSGDESAFRVHSQGLKSLIHRRGGLSQMPPQLATYVTLLLITLAMLKGLDGSCVLPASNFISDYAQEKRPYVSPLYAPHGNFASLHGNCSSHTLDVIVDTYRFSQGFLNQNDTTGIANPPPNHRQTHTRLLYSLSPQDSTPHDWLHESVRLTALIHTHALLHGTTLAESANTTDHNTTPGAATRLHLLLNALERTDTTHCWGALRGVFLWVCLIGGAAAWATGEAGQPVSSSTAWARKCFSLWAIQAVVSVGFAHTDATVEALGCALRIRNVLDGRGA